MFRIVLMFRYKYNACTGHYTPYTGKVIACGNGRIMKHSEGPLQAVSKLVENVGYETQCKKFGYVLPVGKKFKTSQFYLRQHSSLSTTVKPVLRS